MTITQTPSTLVLETGPRIYLACLAAYNEAGASSVRRTDDQPNGRLHGAWVEADQGEDHVRDCARAMLAGSPAPNSEECAIHDYEGFEGASISEYASFESVCALAEFLSEHGELGAKLYEYYGNNLDDACTALDHYAGKYTSVADFAETLHDDIGTEIPESVSCYIDWERLARDMVLSGDIITFQTGFDAVHVFWSW
ncbi:MAG: antirestriction protein ArdA [Pseudomonadota bacterium]